ncbi:MAG: ATP-binding protein [Microlunatus sp.]|nr:ATP-binding protein [Microlunatus sp.]
MNRHRARARTGRDIPGLLADFGHDLPTTPAPGPDTTPARLFRRVPAWGPRTRGRGWAPAGAPVVTYRMGSDQAGALWPFIAGPGLPPTGAQMGIDVLSGAAFYADPVGWVLREDIPVTNPNVICLGKPGTGKSATTKAFALRMTDFGYRILILGDPKDEYEDLCRFFGVQPITLGPGLPARINPLGLGPLGEGWAQLSAQQAQARAAIIHARWLTLMRALVGSQRIGTRPVPFGPSQESVIKTALAHLTGYATGNTHLSETTIPLLWHHLDTPTDDLITSCRYATRQDFLDDTRLLRDALGQLVSGALAGLFDDHTNIDIDWGAPIQSLSLSRLNPLGDEAVGIALVCLNSWGRAMREIAAPGDLRIVIRDEMWKAMRLGIEAVKSLDEDLRLSRGVAGRGGDIQWANAHKPSDMLTVGDAGSQAANIARDLMHLADIKILHGQKPGVANELDTMLGLGAQAVEAMTGWAMHSKGRALWLVGDTTYKVQTRLHPIEERLTYTNDALHNAL